MPRLFILQFIIISERDTHTHGPVTVHCGTARVYINICMCIYRFSFFLSQRESRLPAHHERLITPCSNQQQLKRELYKYISFFKEENSSPFNDPPVGRSFK